jgi:hypothetical protein
MQYAYHAIGASPVGKTFLGAAIDLSKRAKILRRASLMNDIHVHQSCPAGFPVNSKLSYAEESRNAN